MDDDGLESSHGDSAVITLVGTMTVVADREDEFLDLATRTARAVHESEPGTILYALHGHPTEPHAYVWVERYRGAEALKAHNEAPFIAEAMAKLPNLLSKPPELIQLNQVVPA